MNDYRAYVECDYNSIYHHGIKGQKWGVRRYQNEDGTFTEAGKKRYGRLIDLREKIDQTHPRDSQGRKIKGIYKNSPEREKLISDYRKELNKYNNKLTGETSSDIYDAIEEHMKHRKLQSSDSKKGKLFIDSVMKAGSRDSKIVKQAKKDWVDLTDSEFRKKYFITKEHYYKRVKKGEGDWIAPRGFSKEKKYND